MPPKNAPKTPAKIVNQESSSESSDEENEAIAAPIPQKVRKRKHESESEASSSEEEEYDYKAAATINKNLSGDLNKIWDGVGVHDLQLFRSIHAELKHFPNIVSKIESEGGAALKDYTKKLSIFRDNIKLQIDYLETVEKVDGSATYYFMKVVLRELDDIGEKLSCYNETKGALGLICLKFNGKLMKSLLGKTTCSEIDHALKLYKNNKKMFKSSSAALHGWKSEKKFFENKPSGSKPPAKSFKTGYKPSNSKPMFPKKVKKDEE